jgi:hypothetical protein
MLGSTLGVVVSYVGVGEPLQLLGDESADGRAPSGGGDLGAVDYFVIELDGQVAFGHPVFSSPHVLHSLSRGSRQQATDNRRS